jgi:hypothetical protein
VPEDEELEQEMFGMRKSHEIMTSRIIKVSRLEFPLIMKLLMVVAKKLVAVDHICTIENEGKTSLLCRRN